MVYDGGSMIHNSESRGSPEKYNSSPVKTEIVHRNVPGKLEIALKAVNSLVNVFLGMNSMHYSLNWK